MNIVITYTLYWAGAFALGSIPTAYLAGRIFKGIDIRSYGSGNVGTTNAFRVLGKKIGTTVFMIDFLKGYLPVFLLPVFLSSNNWDAKEVGLWIGTGSIAGHVFTPFLNFKGGKGIATGAGVLCGTFPFLFMIVAGVWLIVFTMTQTVSISSLVAVFGLVIASILIKLKVSVILFFLCSMLFIVWTHRSNISRLLQGKENK